MALKKNIGLLLLPGCRQIAIQEGCEADIEDRASFLTTDNLFIKYRGNVIVVNVDQLNAIVSDDDDKTYEAVTDYIKETCKKLKENKAWN